MMKRLIAVSLLLLSTIFLMSSATSAADGSSQSERLLRLLVAKGVLSQSDVLEFQSADGDAELRLIALLQRKGVLTDTETSELLGLAQSGNREQGTGNRRILAASSQ